MFLIRVVVVILRFDWFFVEGRFGTGYRLLNILVILNDPIDHWGG